MDILTNITKDKMPMPKFNILDLFLTKKQQGLYVGFINGILFLLSFIAIVNNVTWFVYNKLSQGTLQTAIHLLVIILNFIILSLMVKYIADIWKDKEVYFK